ncbi:coilin [Genypterus blacodes]|uniref:coilin n=1 Tax=Genypterus blacodes TaxID=154954 RepID=UPI003F76247C
MAAPGNTSIRVRLHFDYAPPAVSGCRMCWLLVDLNKCRVVADLESIIREKFDLSTRSILNLFIEDCYLPHTESIHVVRDNDSVRVKVDSVAEVNGHHDPNISHKKSRKRQRCTEEEIPSQNEVGLEQNKEKTIKRSKESLQRDTDRIAHDERDLQRKNTDKKKKKRAEENVPISTPKPTTKGTPASVERPVKSTKKPATDKSKARVVTSSDSSDSSSEEEEAPKRTAAQKEAPKIGSSSPVRVRANTKLSTSKSRSTPVSAPPDTDRSSESTNKSHLPKSTSAPPSIASTTPKGGRSQNSTSQMAHGSLPSTDCAQGSVSCLTSSPAQKALEQPQVSNSNGEEEIELVIRKPIQQPFQSSWRGPGWRNDMAGGSGRGRGRGESRSPPRRHSGFGLSGDGGQQDKQQMKHDDSLTNSSVILQNGSSGESKQDYSLMPLLAAPPQVGKKIAFKLLELTENYTPEVSDYKEGKILSFDPTTKQIELEVLNAPQAPVEPGKFDLVYQNPDGSESVEYAVSRSILVTERWDSLLEARLII